jgi:hypothetical protein
MTVPDPMFVDPTHARNDDGAVAVHPITGVVFEALLIIPSGGNVVDSEYVVLYREDLNGQRTELKRYYARDSRTWINQHGGSGASDEGKYGWVRLAVSNDDLIMLLNMRANGIQRTFPIRERGLAK